MDNKKITGRITLNYNSTQTLNTPTYSLIIEIKVAFTVHLGTQTKWLKRFRKNSSIRQYSAVKVIFNFNTNNEYILQT